MKTGIVFITIPSSGDRKNRHGDGNQAKRAGDQENQVIIFEGVRNRRIVIAHQRESCCASLAENWSLVGQRHSIGPRTAFSPESNCSRQRRWRKGAPLVTSSTGSRQRFRTGSPARFRLESAACA